jgi:hypothetical protein
MVSEYPGSQCNYDNDRPYRYKDLRAELLMSISGKVIDYDTGKGIAGITVVISMDKWAKTDKDGNFVITEVPEGRYELDIARMVASVSEYYVPHIYPEYIDVQSGKNVRNIKIYLRKGATVSGRVLAEDGVTPIKGALVIIDSHETNFYAEIERLFEWSKEFPKSKVSFYTNENGEFLLKGILEEFSFDILVMAYGYADEWKRGLRVKYGEELRIGDIIMGRRSRSVVRGKVYYPDMSPMCGARVWIGKMGNKIASEKEDDGGWALTDSKGEFEIRGLTPGYYFIDAIPPESEGDKYYTKTIFDFYISEAKDNYVEIKAFEREKKPMSYFNEGIEPKFIRASIFPILMLGVAIIDSTCACVQGGPSGIDFFSACNVILDKENNPVDASPKVPGCPKVPDNCHIKNCKKDRVVRIKCEECPSSVGTECGHAQGCGKKNKIITVCYTGPRGTRPMDCQRMPTHEILAHEMLHLCDCGLEGIYCKEACAHCTIANIYGDHASSVTKEQCDLYKKQCPSAH